MGESWSWIRWSGLATVCVMLGAGCSDDDALVSTDDGAGAESDASAADVDGSPATTPDAAAEVDAGSVQADAAADATACDDEFATTALFCSGFEGASLEAEGFGVYNNGGVASISTEAPWRGSGSFRSEVTNPGTGGSTAAVAISRPPLPQTGSLYMRAYIRPSPTAPGTAGSIVLMQIQRNSGSYHSAALDLRPDTGSGLTMFTQISTAGRGSTEVGPRFTLPLGQWTCLEMHLELSDAPDGLIEIFANGTKILEIVDVVTRSTEGDYNEAQIGMGYAPADVPSAVMEADEFVVSTTPIGCD